MDLNKRFPLAIYLPPMGMELCVLYMALALLWKSFNPSIFPILLTMALYPLSLLSRARTIRSPGTARKIEVVTFALGTMGVSMVTLLAIQKVLIGSSGLTGPGLFWIGLHVVFCGLSWGLGSTLIREETEHRYFAFRFQAGLLFILFLGGIEDTSWVPIVLFFVLAAISLALARWQDSLCHGGILLGPFRPGLLAWSSVGLVLSGLLIVFILSPEVARSIWQGMALWGRAMVLLFSYLPPPRADRPSDFHFSCSWRPEAPPKQGIPLRTTPADGGPIEIPSLVLWAVLMGIFIGVLTAMILIVRKIKANRSGSSGPAAEVEIQPLSMKILEGLASMIGRWWRRAGRFWLFLLAKLTWLPGPPEEESANSLRELYRNLLRWAAKRGVPRGLSDTPLEYLNQLCQNFPEGKREWTVITDAYIQARYSLVQQEGPDFKMIRRAWQKIQSFKK